MATETHADQPTRAEVEAFLFLEARLADEHRYEAWEQLWTDDGVYWVPAGADADDPTSVISYIHDNRQRIGSRMRQLRSGSRYAQEPRSRLRRSLANIEIGTFQGPQVAVAANFTLVEVTRRRTVLWAGRTDYLLRSSDAGLHLARKKVLLVNRADELTTMAFII